jgi:DNA repair protein RadA/Sms
MRWVGQCPGCEAWNTLHEEVEVSEKEKRFESQPVERSQPVRLKDVSALETKRIAIGIAECDRLLGGGIVPGSLILIGGEPGIGKSTLLLQLCQSIAVQGLTTFYVSGEESVEQTSLRAKRLQIENDHLFLVSETNFSQIRAHIEKINPAVLIVDSIQMIYKAELSSAPGSVSQVREAATEFLHLAKSRNMAVFLIGHVTKSGEIAGPRVLEHLVDTVLYFEGDKHYHYRLVRVVKNRFGPTDEIAVFQMQEKGLVEVPNPSQLFLEERRKGSIGSAIVPTLEGSRPILIEVQALVSQTVFSTPSRRAAGIDQNRLALLLAVLEKRVGYQLFQCDIFVSIAGGLKIIEPAIDLGILIAVASSFRSKPIDPDLVIIGEVGLGGELRSVPRLENRLKEAMHMGFRRAIVPARNVKGLSPEILEKLTVHGVDLAEEAIHLLFE